MTSATALNKPSIWDFPNDGKCYGILKNGNRCNKPTKINQMTKKHNLWCDQHQTCSDQRRLMKLSCRGSNTRCSDFKNINAIQAQKDVIQTCMSNRLNMWNNCYHKDVHDERHYRAITFLQDRVKECKDIIEDYNEMNPKEEKTKKVSISQNQLDLIHLTKDIAAMSLESKKAPKSKTTGPALPSAPPSAPPSAIPTQQKKKKSKKQIQPEIKITKQEEDDVFATFTKMAEAEQKALKENQQKKEALAEEKELLKSKIIEYRTIKLDIMNKISDIENYGIQNEVASKKAITIGTKIIEAIDKFVKEPNATYADVIDILLYESAEPSKAVDKIIDDNYKTFELKAKITFEIIKQLIFLDLFMYQIYNRVDEFDQKEVEYIVNILQKYKNFYQNLRKSINQVNFDNLAEIKNIRNEYNLETDKLVELQKSIFKTKLYNSIYDMKFHTKLYKLYPPKIEDFENDLGGYLNILKNYKI